MGLFDLFKKREEPEQPKNIAIQAKPEIIPTRPAETNLTGSNSIIKYCTAHQIPQTIQSLLWFADGPFRNLSPEKEKFVDVTDKIRIVFTISYQEEPSVIFSDLPLDFNFNLDPKESIGYYPTYRRLTPQQRHVYVNWLCDTRQAIDIGYVFIFYYGLERHLIYGNYREAAETILNLRAYHKHHSFLDYSSASLIGSAILHKDKEMLIRCLKEIGDYPIHTDITLLAKYFLKCELSPEDIIALRSAAGFKKTTYLKEYPELFRNHLSNILTMEFGHESFPFFDLILNPPEKPIILFANTSLANNIRYPNLPSIIDDENFKNAINKILLSTHEAVKEYLIKQRKIGSKPTPLSEIIDENEPPVACPYCHKTLAKMPKAKKKCPECGQIMYIKSLPTDRKKRLIREEQLADIEEQWAHYYRSKKVQEYMRMNNISTSRYDQIYESLKLKHGAEPSDKDVIIELIELSSMEHSNNYDMGLFRNDIFYKGQMFESFGDKNSALAMLHEECYLHVNGPNNRGSFKNNPDLLKDYPQFDPGVEGDTRLAPGIVMDVKKISTELVLSMDEIQSRFINHNSLVLKALNPPITPEKAWEKIQKALVNEDTK